MFLLVYILYKVSDGIPSPFDMIWLYTHCCTFPRVQLHFASYQNSL